MSKEEFTIHCLKRLIRAVVKFSHWNCCDGSLFFHENVHLAMLLENVMCKTNKAFTNTILWGGGSW